jgi:RNA polymerase sigma-70 factor (ECF subfamily)
MEMASLAVTGSTHSGKARDFVTPELDQLYERYAAMVYKTALRVTGNPADAEDVLQSVFLRILDRQLLPSSAGSPEHYLRRAATNASIDVLRRKAARAESDFDDRRKHEAKESTLLLKERLRRALARQPAENAELFVMCYLEGYSYDELAERYQLEPGTVASRLHRIRAAIRKDLGE